MTKFDILIDGNKVSYLKRVSHGAPSIEFAKTPDQYTLTYSERVAKGWVNTLIKYGFNAEMVTTQNKIPK